MTKRHMVRLYLACATRVLYFFCFRGTVGINPLDREVCVSQRGVGQRWNSGTAVYDAEL